MFINYCDILYIGVLWFLKIVGLEGMRNCGDRGCANCKYAVHLFESVYCSKLRARVDDVSECPHFEVELLEYKLFRRA